MEKDGHRQCTPRNTDPAVTEEPWVDFSSGYIQGSLHLFPKQGSKPPCKLHQNYTRGIMTLRFRRIDERVMEFANPPSEAAAMRA